MLCAYLRPAEAERFSHRTNGYCGGRRTVLFSYLLLELRMMTCNKESEISAPVLICIVTSRRSVHNSYFNMSCESKRKVK